MAEAKVRWTNSRTFIGVDSTGHSVVMSTPKDGIGMKPSDLMLVSLAACSSVDVVSILEKKKKHLEKLEVSVSATQDDEPPWTFRKIHLIYTIKGEGIEAPDVEKAIALSEGKYCSVADTLKGKSEISWEFVIE